MGETISNRKLRLPLICGNGSCRQCCRKRLSKTFNGEVETFSASIGDNHNKAAVRSSENDIGEIAYVRHGTFYTNGAALNELHKMPVHIIVISAFNG